MKAEKKEDRPKTDVAYMGLSLSQDELEGLTVPPGHGKQLQ